MSKCILSRGHDWDGLTCMACGRTTFDDYKDHIIELQQELSETKSELESLRDFCQSEIRKMPPGYVKHKGEGIG